MTTRSLHTMTIDLPMHAGDMDGELEVDIVFTWQPETESLHFVVADPAQPFSGPYAERAHDILQGQALEWFEKNHVRALQQIKTDEEDGL